MSPFSNQYCPNASCTFYEKVGLGNVVVHSKKRKRLQCKECKQTWSKTTDTLNFGLKTDPKVIMRALFLLDKGTSIRQVALSQKVSPSTISRWKNRKQSLDRNQFIKSKNVEHMP